MWVFKTSLHHLEGFVCVSSVCGLLKKRSSQHLSPATIQTLTVQLSVPLWVDESNYDEHFQERENAAPPLFTAVLSCSLQPIPRSYLTVLKIIHPLPLLPWQQEGKSISSASSSHSLLPFLPSLSLPLSLSFPPGHHFLYLSMPSLVILLSSGLSQRIDMQAADDAASSTNRTVIIPCFTNSHCTFVFGWIMLCHLLTAVRHFCTSY